MSDFAFDVPEPTFTAKTDKNPIGAGDPTKYMQASDVQSITAALVNLRTGVKAGMFHGLTEQAADPSIANAALQNVPFHWAKTDHHHYLHLQNNTNMQLDGVGAPGVYTLASITVDAHGRVTAASSGSVSASTLQASYTSGSGGTAGTITATAAGGNFSWTQGVATSGSPTGFTFVGGAHTTLAASTEAPSVNLNLSAQVQFATGSAWTSQRAFLVQAPTYKFVGASSIPDVATMAITGAPIAGTNATFTRSYAFWAQGGLTRLDGGLRLSGIGASAQSILWMDATSGNTVSASSQFVWDQTNRRLSTNGLGNYGITIATTTSGDGGLYIACSATSPAANGVLLVKVSEYTAGVSAETNGLHVQCSTSLNGGIAVASNITTQRLNLFDQPTYLAGTAKTLTTAATVAIAGPPVASTNVTITNTPISLWVQAGLTRLDGAAILNGSGTACGFYGSAGTTKPTVSGAKLPSDVVLASLLTALAGLGLLTDSST